MPGISVIPAWSKTSGIKDIIQRGANCTILYNLNGSTHKQFNRQRMQLQTHLDRLRIKLMDLNNWQGNKEIISGRNKKRLREHFALSKKENKVLIFNERRALVTTKIQGFDLVQLIMECKKS